MKEHSPWATPFFSPSSLSFIYKTLLAGPFLYILLYYFIVMKLSCANDEYFCQLGTIPIGGPLMDRFHALIAAQ